MQHVMQNKLIVWAAFTSLRHAQPSSRTHSMPTTTTPPRSRTLLDRLAHRVPARLLREHDAEPLKVGHLLARGGRRALLRPRALLPLPERVRLLELALDRGGARAAREARNDERRERQVAVGEGLPRDGGRGAVDDGLERVCQGGSEGGGAGVGRTRLWSIISAMTAALPAEGPELMRTTVSDVSNRLNDENGNMRTTADLNETLESGKFLYRHVAS